MNEAKRRFLLSGMKLFDVFQLTVSFGLSALLVAQSQRNVSVEQFLSIRIKLSNCIVFCLIVMMWQGIFSLCGVYESKRLAAKHIENIELLKATALSSIILALLAGLFRITLVTPPFLILFWVVSSLLCITSRRVIRPFLAAVRKRGRNLRYMLVLGTNSRAIDFARKILQTPELGYRLVGFVDDDWNGLSQFKETGFPLVSDHKGLAEFLRRNIVDEVAMYLPLRSFYQGSFGAAALCAQFGIIMRFDGDILA